MPIIAISYYNHPSADDYGYSKNVHVIYENNGTVADIIKGAYDTSMEYMQKWQGLYSAAFLLALQPAAFHERLYAITSVIIMMILTIGIITLMNSIIHNGLRVKSKEGYFIGFIISFYMIQCMPDRV